MVENIKKFFSWLWNTVKKFTFKDWIIIALAILGLRYAIAAHYYKGKANTPTVVYLNDSLEIYKNKLKEEYKARDLYIQEVSDLKKHNKELYEEVKSLKDNPIIVTKTKVVVKTDTIFMHSDSITVADNDSIRNLYWHQTHPDGYYDISGQTSVYTDFSSFNTKLTSLKMPVNLTFDLIEKDKQLKFIGKTDNPYISIESMNGAVIDPAKSKVLKNYFKQKKLGIGFQLGYGITPELKGSAYIGVGLNYNIISFW